MDYTCTEKDRIERLEKFLEGNGQRGLVRQAESIESNVINLDKKVDAIKTSVDKKIDSLKWVIASIILPLIGLIIAVIRLR